VLALPRLLHAVQQERKAALDQDRVDLTFRVVDPAVLLTKGVLDCRGW
jgi:hypothetical protein